MIGGKVKIFSSLGVRVAQQGCGEGAFWAPSGAFVAPTVG